MRVSDFSTVWTHKLVSVGGSYNGQLSCLQWPIRFSLWACTTHIAIQGPCLAGSPLPKQHVFSLCKFFPLFWVTPGGLRGLGLKGGAVPPGVHLAIPPSPLMFPSTIMGTHTCNLLCMCNRGYIPT